VSPGTGVDLRFNAAVTLFHFLRTLSIQGIGFPCRPSIASAITMTNLFNIARLCSEASEFRCLNLFLLVNGFPVITGTHIHLPQLETPPISLLHIRLKPVKHWLVVDDRGMVFSDELLSDLKDLGGILLHHDFRRELLIRTWRKVRRANELFEGWSKRLEKKNRRDGEKKESGDTRPTRRREMKSLWEGSNEEVGTGDQLDRA
jgi:hypothetical protein